MINLTNDSDNNMFNVFEATTYIGHIWRGSDNKWVFEADLDKLSDYIMSDITKILGTLNL